MYECMILRRFKIYMDTYEKNKSLICVEMLEDGVFK
jgi:hypothetical protein